MLGGLRKRYEHGKYINYVIFRRTIKLLKIILTFYLKKVVLYGEMGVESVTSIDLTEKLVSLFHTVNLEQVIHSSFTKISRTFKVYVTITLLEVLYVHHVKFHSRLSSVIYGFFPALHDWNLKLVMLQLQKVNFPA